MVSSFTELTYALATLLKGSPIKADKSAKKHVELDHLVKIYGYEWYRVDALDVDNCETVHVSVSEWQGKGQKFRQMSLHNTSRMSTSARSPT